MSTCAPRKFWVVAQKLSRIWRSTPCAPVCCLKRRAWTWRGDSGRSLRNCARNWFFRLTEKWLTEKWLTEKWLTGKWGSPTFNRLSLPKFFHSTGLPPPHSGALNLAVGFNPRDGRQTFPRRVSDG